jgi:hypothetical protein
VQADRIEDFRAAADFINGAELDVLCVQHEFGIFGGVAGAHVDELLERVRVPVVTTLHTVLPDPSPELAAATRELADRSDVLVVLAEQAVDLLVKGCGVDRDKVRVIPHGVPAGPRIDRDKAKEGIVARGRTVLLTFGLLSPGKGIEVVLEALPAVVAQHPDVLYVVLGATHPHVLRNGDDYRTGLVARAEELGVSDHVRFVDRYVDLEELRRHLAASDVYITPYHGSDQIVSGTLAYAVGSGCVVVSTPYAYARELPGRRAGGARAVPRLRGDGGDPDRAARRRRPARRAGPSRPGPRGGDELAGRSARPTRPVRGGDRAARGPPAAAGSRTRSRPPASTTCAPSPTTSGSSSTPRTASRSGRTATAPTTSAARWSWRSRAPFAGTPWPPDWFPATCPSCRTRSSPTAASRT